MSASVCVYCGTPIVLFTFKEGAAWYHMPGMGSNEAYAKCGGLYSSLASPAGKGDTNE